MSCKECTQLSARLKEETVRREAADEAVVALKEQVSASTHARRACVGEPMRATQQLGEQSSAPLLA